MLHCAADIANAVLDGVDGILLGAETLRGSYPVEAVATIAKICRCAFALFAFLVFCLVVWLLGAETLRGSYLVEAVATIAEICR
jgi:pyruvate kinase